MHCCAWIFVADANAVGQAQAAREVLATLNLALQGPDDAARPSVADEDMPAALEGIHAGQDAQAMPADGTAAFGNIENAYLPPVVWPATPHSNRAGQSYGDFSQSVATELQRIGGQQAQAGHVYGHGAMQQVERQAGPNQLVKNLAAAGMVIVFGGLAIFLGPGVFNFRGSKHRR